MARPSNKEARRRDIVQAFLQVMAEKGYAGATVRAVGEAAGLSPGLIHHHFTDKQAILLAAVANIVETFKKRFEAMKHDSLSPQEKLQAFINARLSLGEGSDEKIVKAWVTIGSEAVRQQAVRAIYRKTIREQTQYLAELLKRASPDELDSNDHEAKAAIILSAIEGAYLLGVTCKSDLPEGFAAEQLNALVS